MKKVILSFFLLVSAVFATSAQSLIPESVSRWNVTIAIGYNPINFKGQMDYDMDALSAEVMAEKLISESASLYVDFGARVQYAFDSFKSYGDDHKVEMMTFTIPATFRYSYDFGSTGFSVMPFTGLNIRFNISAKEKIEGAGGTYEYDFFSDDDMSQFGMDSWNRVQLGYHSGVAMAYDMFRVTFWYGEEFNDIGDDTGTDQFGISLGLTF